MRNIGSLIGDNDIQHTCLKRHKVQTHTYAYGICRLQDFTLIFQPPANFMFARFSETVRMHRHSLAFSVCMHDIKVTDSHELAKVIDRFSDVDQNESTHKQRISR